MSACGESQTEPTTTAVKVASNRRQQTIVLGDVDPNDPTKKIKRFQPLAGDLAQNLSDFGIRESKVLIARDVEEMGEFMNIGMVDVYFDSSFPTLAVQNLADSKIILRRWKDDDPVYWSVFIARTD